MGKLIHEHQQRRRGQNSAVMCVCRYVYASIENQVGFHSVMVLDLA